MRRPPTPTAAIVAALLSAVLVSACSLRGPSQPRATAAPAASAAPLRLRLIAVNDFHGQLEPSGLSLNLPDPTQSGQRLSLPAGGAAALAGLVQALRQGAAHSLLIAAGDQVGAAPLVSTAFRHESTIDVLNRVGVDLAVPGNHEFDAGFDELQRLHQGGCAPAHPLLESCSFGRHEGARFPLIAANVRRAADGQPAFPPALVREVEGVRVGFIGAVTRSTPGIVVPSGVAGLRFDDEAEALNAQAHALQAQGVKALVAIVHEGGELDPAADWNDASCPGARGPIFDIARRLDPAITVVLSAHTHQGYRCVIDGRSIVQAGAYGRGLAVVDLALDRRSGAALPADTLSRNLPVFNAHSAGSARDALLAATPAPWQQALRQAQPDGTIAQRVADYSLRVAPRAERVVGRIPAALTRRPEPGFGDSAAGRAIADAQLAATRAAGAELALMNPGGIRTDLPCALAEAPCAVTFGQAFTMQPFGNLLITLTFKGRELRQLLESQRRADGRASFLIPSAGLSYRWMAGAPAGQQVRDLTLHGRLVGDEQPVRLTVNSFLAEGGDGFPLLTQGRDRVVGAPDIDALIAWLGGPEAAHQKSPRIAIADQ